MIKTTPFDIAGYAMTRVKICGLMTEKDVHMCAKAGADAVGFVTEYPISVPWNISREKARDLAAMTPPFMTSTAVVGGPVETILQIAETVRPNLLQLHGDETLAEIGQICLALENTGTKVIKALRIDVDTGKAKFAIEDPLEAVKVLAATGISGLVVDSKTASRPAGTGVPLDWGNRSEDGRLDFDPLDFGRRVDGSKRDRGNRTGATLWRGYYQRG